MKNQALEFDNFDIALSELLQGDEMPAGDFTARVIAQVKETAQDEKKTSRHTLRPRYIATLAACAAVVVLCAPFLRMMFGGMGDMKAADQVAPAAAPMAPEIYQYAAEGDHWEEESTVTGGGNTNFSARESIPEPTAPAEPAAPAEPIAPDDSYAGKKKEDGSPVVECTEGPMEEVQLPVIAVEPALFEEVSAWLEEHGFDYEAGYPLTAADVAALNEQFPELALEEVDCILRSA